MFYTAAYIGRYLIQKLVGLAVRTRCRIIIKKELMLYLPIFGERTVGIFRRFVFLPMTIDIPRDVLGIIQRYILDLIIRSFFCFGTYTSAAPRIWYLIRISSLMVNINIFVFTRRMLSERLFFLPTSTWSTRLFITQSFIGLPIYIYTTYQLAFAMLQRIQKVFILFREIQLCGFFLNNVCYTVDDIAEYGQRVSIHQVTNIFLLFRGFFCVYYSLLILQYIKYCFISTFFFVVFFLRVHNAFYWCFIK